MGNSTVVVVLDDVVGGDGGETTEGGYFNSPRLRSMLFFGLWAPDDKVSYCFFCLFW